MKKGFIKRGRLPGGVILIVLLIGLIGWALTRWHVSRGWLESLTVKSKQFLGLHQDSTPEERRIREEVVLKKMEEANLNLAWRGFAPEYPKPRSVTRLPEKERMQALKETPEFKEMDQEVKTFGKKREELIRTDPSLPSLQDATHFTHLSDRGTEKVIQRLLNSKEKEVSVKPLEENLRLGMKGPAASRRILERPSLPPLRVTVETEIELTFWILPDGMVDRVLPSVRGDAELERVGIQYLKQWRFAPLQKDHPQIEQWGTLPIQFRLTRKNP